MKNYSLTKLPRSVLVALCVALLAVWVGPAAAQLDEDVFISEVLADPAGDWDGDGVIDFKGDEWVEIHNKGDVPVDLSDWYLRDGLGEEPHLRLSGILAPGEAAVFYGSDAVAWQTGNGLSTVGLSLNNSGDLVQLLRQYQDVDGPAFELMFVISYDDHEAEDERSSGFNPATTDWILYDALNPYSGSVEPVGTGCAPTPGIPNQCGGEVALEARSFGEVKAIFR